MRKFIRISLITILGLGIGYQAYIYLNPEKTNKPTIPDIPLTLLDGTKSSLDEIGSGNHTIVFLVRSNCEYCKAEASQVRKFMDKVDNTQFLFISFEDTSAIRNYRQVTIPEVNPHIVFAQASRGDIEPFLEEELVFPYMLWYDDEGIQKGQHRGLFPVSRIIEVIRKAS